MKKLIGSMFTLALAAASLSTIFFIVVLILAGEDRNEIARDTEMFFSNWKSINGAPFERFYSNDN